MRAWEFLIAFSMQNRRRKLNKKVWRVLNKAMRGDEVFCKRQQIDKFSFVYFGLAQPRVWLGPRCLLSHVKWGKNDDDQQYYAAWNTPRIKAGRAEK